MKISVSLRSRGVTPDQMVARAVAAREAGVHALYVGDHHSQEGYVQNNVILGRMLAEWPRTIGAVFILPLWHPVLLAEQVGTLAGMTGGDFVVQAALGHGEHQFDAMGVTLRSRVRRFEEGLATVQSLLRGSEVSSTGPVAMKGARVGRVDNVRYWIAGHSDQALSRAARLAEGWVAPPGIGDEEAAVLAAAYHRACDGVGRAHGAVAIRRDVFVGDTDDEARVVMTGAVERGYRGFDPSVLIAGAPATVARRVARLGDAGFTEMVFRQLSEDQDAALESISRLRAVRAMVES